MNFRTADICFSGSFSESTYIRLYPFSAENVSHIDLEFARLQSDSSPTCANPIVIAAGFERVDSSTTSLFSVPHPPMIIIAPAIITASRRFFLHIISHPFHRISPHLYTIFADNLRAAARLLPHQITY